MLSLNKNFDELWLELQSVKIELKKYANWSLLESQREKDEFLANCHVFVSKLNFDSVRGGFYYEANSRVIFSSFKNLIVVDFLTAVANTFFDGELNYLGRKILSQIVRTYNNLNLSIIPEFLSYEEKRTPFILSGEILNERLDAGEIALLQRLLGLDCLTNELFKPRKNYWICYRNKLQIAADLAEIHFKQAQIIEENLRLKIDSLIDRDYILATSSKSTNLTLNAYFLTVLTELQIRNPSVQYGLVIKKLENVLVENLTCSSHLTDDQKLEICYALLNSAQLNLLESRVQLVTNNLINLNLELIISDKSKSILLDAISIINELERYKNNDLSFNQLDLKTISSLSTKVNENLSIKFLSGSCVEKDKQKEFLLSSYDYSLRIFSIT